MAEQDEDTKEEITETTHVQTTSLHQTAASLQANFAKFGTGNTKEELIRKDIMKKPGLHQADALNLQIKSDKLKKSLKNKSPQKQKELVSSGIIKHDKLPHTLTAAATSLEAAQKADALKQQFGKRSNKEELHEMGILQNKGIADSLQATAKQLETAKKNRRIEKQFNQQNREEVPNGINCMCICKLNELQFTKRILNFFSFYRYLYYMLILCMIASAGCI
eukprot:313214_1